ncbi:hypothetical protein [Mucilaginibacter ginkgonis]|uniref:D-alanyl-D-alanine carboxypeptidase-like protein n=1 Tax=Mucilaginibacter ginkgonis TaxID=2682091 RepID=A0A6I4I2F2_9SPHI|nr:hypothetical protein [Mucilaginibacter ginkgonis]QQL50795.1 hypothetical protein GO620_004880 [Mucilaginibacter ginkgonis]
MDSSFSGYDSYDTDNGDDGDNDNETATTTNSAMPTSHIPSTIILANGNTVQVLFGTTSTDHLYADRLVDSRLVTAITNALNIAESNGAYIVSIYIEATTNGTHTNANSNHYRGTAVDISRINGIPLIVQHASKAVKTLQTAFDQLPNIRENFGPYFKHKQTLPWTIGGHENHIHISINQ